MSEYLNKHFILRETLERVEGPDFTMATLRQGLVLGGVIHINTMEGVKNKKIILGLRDLVNNPSADEVQKETIQLFKRYRCSGIQDPRLTFTLRAGTKIYEGHGVSIVLFIGSNLNIARADGLRFT